MKKLLKKILISGNIVLSSMVPGISISKRKDNEEEVVPTTLKKSKIDEIEREAVVEEIEKVIDLDFKRQEEEVYKAYGLPLYKGSIKVEYTVNKDEQGNNINGGLNGKSQVTMEKLYELTEEDKKLLKKYDEQNSNIIYDRKKD